MPYEDYKALSFIGKGGYGEVYKVQHAQTSELFAMKTVSISHYHSVNIQILSSILNSERLHFQWLLIKIEFYNVAESSLSPMIE